MKYQVGDIDLWNKAEDMLYDMIDCAKKLDIAKNTEYGVDWFTPENDYYIHIILFKLPEKDDEEREVIHSWNFAWRKISHLYFEEPAFEVFFANAGCIDVTLIELLSFNGDTILKKINESPVS